MVCVVLSSLNHNCQSLDLIFSGPDFCIMLPVLWFRLGVTISVSNCLPSMHSLIWLKCEGVCCAEFHRCDRHGRRLPCLEGEWTSCQIPPSLRITTLVSSYQIPDLSIPWCVVGFWYSQVQHSLYRFIGSGINFSHLISSSLKIPKWNVSDIGTHCTSWSGQIFTWSVHSHIEDFFYRLLNLRSRKMLFPSYIIWVTHGFWSHTQESVTNHPIWCYMHVDILFKGELSQIPFVLWLSWNKRAGIWSLSTTSDWIWAHLLQYHTGLLDNQKETMSEWLEWCYVLHVSGKMNCQSPPSICFKCY